MQSCQFVYNKITYLLTYLNVNLFISNNWTVSLSRCLARGMSCGVRTEGRADGRTSGRANGRADGRPNTRLWLVKLIAYTCTGSLLDF